MTTKVCPLSGKRKRKTVVVPQEIQLLTEEIQYERVGMSQENRYPAKIP